MRYSSAIPQPKVGLKSEPIVAGATHLNYQYQGWKIQTALLNGRVIAQSYQKPIQHANGHKVSESELQAIMEAESAGQKWERIAIAPDAPNLYFGVIGTLSGLSGKSWKRTDGAVATLNFSGDRILFQSKEALDLASQKKKSAEDNKRKNIPQF